MMYFLGDILFLRSFERKNSFFFSHIGEVSGSYTPFFLLKIKWNKTKLNTHKTNLANIPVCNLLDPVSRDHRLMLLLPQLEKYKDRLFWGEWMTSL